MNRPSSAGSDFLRRECDIKGDIDREGGRIYYVPGSFSHYKVSINTLQGERLFCTEQEAVDAGWRKAREKRQ